MAVQPWYQVCKLREDVRKGELALAEFAADLNDVRTGDAPPVYRDPGMFFDRTYPTFRMKELARDVLHRLAGQGGKPVLRLQVAYGGGKTHTLITLMHLAENGGSKVTHRTIGEFLTFAGLSQAPKARVALLPCDKFDVKEGLEVYNPEGKTRHVHTLWGALAYQLAGDVGYDRLKKHDEDLTVPAEPLLVALLRAPLKEGLGALVLVDEAVWYYRQAVLSDPRMLGAIKDFYQVLNQAVAKVDRAVMVASLIASNLEANDQTGTQCLSALDDVFQRIAEPVEPVTREDVAEILRRRLFDTVPGESECRPSVDAVMAALQKLPVSDAQRDQAAYDRWVDAYPFHPDLISVLYQKWTQMNGFQRTRGALRLLAYALRDSEGKDSSPVVGPAALLPPLMSSGGKSGLSASLNELVEICDESERWTPILIGELEKAQEIQSGLPTMKSREVEQAVVATFLHSQPLGQRAANQELLALVVHPSIDPAAIEEGLRKWRERSWFLIENPDVWQFGTTPNLTHMHVQAMGWLNEPEIDDELRSRIKSVPGLKSADSGVEVHALPTGGSRDINDDLKLHYVILGPECSVELGKPLPSEVEAYFNQKTGPQDPRIYRNNILALAPEVSRLAGLREQIRRYLGWARLEKPDVNKLLTDTQRKQLPGKKQESVNDLPEGVVGTYNILISLDEDGAVRAQGLRTSGAVGGTPFERIKAMLTEEERLVTSVLDPELILPGSYFSLWAEGRASRRATDIMQAFGQFPRLPRLLRIDTLLETLKRGVLAGLLVLRLPRPDGSAQTWWRIPPNDDYLLRPEIEILPANTTVLHNLESDLLKPDQLDGLWPSSGEALQMVSLHQYFDGQRAPKMADDSVIDEAVRSAVAKGILMARIDGAGFFREPLPAGILPDQLELLPPPAPLHGADLTPQAIPEAWSHEQATLSVIAQALQDLRGYAIPWGMLSQSVDEALAIHLLERAPDSGPWPCTPVAIDQVRLRRPEKIELLPETIAKALDYTGTSTPTLRAIKEAIESQFFGGKEVPLDIFTSNAQTALSTGLLAYIDQWQDENPLAVRVRKPSKVLFAEAQLDPVALGRLVENLEELFTAAPELVFTFKVALSAEGLVLDDESLEKLNDILGKIKSGWSLR